MPNLGDLIPNLSLANNSYFDLNNLLSNFDLADVNLGESFIFTSFNQSALNFDNIVPGDY